MEWRECKAVYIRTRNGEKWKGDAFNLENQWVAIRAKARWNYFTKRWERYNAMILLLNSDIENILVIEKTNNNSGGGDGKEGNKKEG